MIEMRRIASYLFVGGTTAVLYYGLIGLLYGVLTLHYLFAVSVAYVAAVTFHFMANRNVTFRRRGSDAKSQIIKYALLAVANYIVTLGVVSLAVGYARLNVYIATTLAILSTVMTGYLGMKHWVFSPSRG